MKTWMLGLGAISFVFGCSSAVVDTGTGGTANSGGSQSGSGGASGGSGGSGGSAAPPAQAGLLLLISSGNQAAGKACNVTALTKTIPDQDPVVVEGPTTTNPGVRVVHGERGGYITCTVSGDSVFAIAGRIEQGSTSIDILDGQVAAGSTGSASVTVYTPETAALTSPSATPCTIDVGSGSLQVASGSIWASFDCPTIEMAPATACAASGVFIFENCTQ